MGVPLRASATSAAGVRSAYWRFAPPAALRDVVACTWESVAGWERPVRVLPDGCVDLVWDGSALLAAPARAEPLRYAVSAVDTPIGIRLRPGVARAVVGIPADELPVEPLPLPFALREPTRAGLEAIVAARLAAAGPPDPLVLAAAAALGRPGVTVDGVCRAVGVSPRELRRRFLADVGLGPKRLQRVLRFQRVLARLGEVAAGTTGLAALAAETGYVDQAHLHRDAHAFAGATPGALVARWARA